MAITVTCPGCSKRLQAPDDRAGQVGKCPQCGTRIPFPPPPPPAVDPLAGFDEFIREQNRSQINRDAGGTSDARPLPKKKSRSLVLCRDCRAPVSRSAKSCPNCGCRNPAVQKWMYAVAAAIAIGPMFILAGWIALAVMTTKPPQPADVAQAQGDVSPTAQAKRKLLIEELISKGIFYKVERPATLPHVWITPTFRELNYDDKQLFISIVYLYYWPTNLVVLKDSRNGERVGSFSPALGLSID